MLLYVFYFAQPQQLQRVGQHIANSRNSCLPTRIHPVYQKKITNDILQKTYTEKGAITGLWLVLFTAEVRKSDNKLANARKEVASYMQTSQLSRFHRVSHGFTAFPTFSQ